MLFLSLKQPTQELLFDIAKTAKHQFDGIELRLDCFETIDVGMINSILKELQIPSCFTLRKKSQGGLYDKSETERENAIIQLLELEPHFLDLEYDTRIDFFNEIKEQFPETIIICSYHNTEETPANLGSILAFMEERPAFAYKICTQANSSLDALRMLDFTNRQTSQGKNVTGLCMGPFGQMTRILQPVVDGFMNYTCLTDDETTADGQIPLDILEERYHYSKLNRETAIFGLVGDPVEPSVSHITHNGVLRGIEANGIYLKIPVTPHQLHPALLLMQQLPFKGLSVTSPLKTIAHSIVDEVGDETKHTQSINTINFTDGLLYGYNTDGIGALDSIEKRGSVEGKKIALLGAGGSAAAIAHEAVKRGGHVILFNRTETKGAELADRLGIESHPLSDFPHFAPIFDILINATTVGMSPDIKASPIDPKHVSPQTLVFDSIYNPRRTHLIKACHEKGCRTISGVEMFVNQAIKQFDLFLNNQVDLDQVEHDLLLSFSS
ncbi:MAG: Shikimate dehydrogenase (NADP(+)) [Chlamydiia bacterium]|nr:Shikimate dehydrogenase (NADP(+)) [Chlamydiia bacterium]